MENGPGLKMYFLFENGDMPASYVSLPEARWLDLISRFNPPFSATKKSPARSKGIAQATQKKTSTVTEVHQL